MTNIEEALRSLREKPLQSTTFERVMILAKHQHSYDGMPQPLRYGNAVYDLLNEVSTPVSPLDLLCGRQCEKILTEDEETILQKFRRDSHNLYHTTLYATGHCTLDWEILVEIGVTGLRERALNGIPTAKDEDHAVFLKGIARVCEAFINFARRYAAAARIAGKTESAEALEAIAAGAPQTFWQGLQLCWLVTLADCAYLTHNPTLTQGRLDVLLQPLYEADVAAGRLTAERAQELITDFYCKHNLLMGRGEHQTGDQTNTTSWDRNLNFDAPQYLLLAGTDDEGRLAANDLTLLFAQAIVPGFKNPIPVIRYVKGMDTACPELWHVLMSKALQSSAMMFYNDADVKAALLQIGVDREDVNHYAHYGCNWCSVGADSSKMTMGPHAVRFSPDMSTEEWGILSKPLYRVETELGWPLTLMDVLKRLHSNGTALQSIDEVIDAFFEEFTAYYQNKLESLNLELTVRQRHPSACLTLGDCINRYAIARGEARAASAKYHFELQSFASIATMVDCLVALEQLVFQEKAVTFAELMTAVEANFVGYEQVLARCRQVEKWGSDGEHSNAMARRLASRAVTVAQSLAAPYVASRRLLLIPSLEGDTWHVRLGARCGATPDGRLAGMPLAQNSRPANGSCKGGLTSLFSSMLQLPLERFASGALNIDVQPQDFRGDAGVTLFGQLLASYFNRGGLHAQISAVSVDDLRDAQLHPDAHRDLLVRITGYSSIFVDVCPTLQNDIIARADL